MTEEEKRALAEKEAAEKAAEAEAAFNAKLNAAVSAREKRFEERLTKLLEERLAKIAPPKAEDKPADKPADGKAVDPEMKLLREKFEALEKKNAEAEARAKQIEEKAAIEKARGTLREALESKGIKGVRAAALLAHFEATNTVRRDDEGNFVFGVSRARAKGAKAEELVYGLDDLTRAMDDWTKTPEAAEFLPPPNAATKQPLQQQQRLGNHVTPGVPGRPLSNADLLADLQKSGLDPNTAV